MKNLNRTLANANSDLAREWHPTGNAPLTPGDVALFSNKKVWWVCEKGHEWAAQISDRSMGKGCPYCSGQRVSEDNSLQAVNPRLASEWHPTKNAPLTPKDVMPSGKRKVWWICRKGHEFETALYNRNAGGGCPYCAMRKVSASNSLQALKPELAREWHPERNTLLTPKDVVPGSVKRVWWLCSRGHAWETSIRKRSKGRRCPYCAGKKVDKDNCLQTVNPALAAQWHPARNAPLTPQDVTSNSGKRAWWLCRNNHEWEAVVASRNGGNGCPYCAGQWVNEENCLQAVNPKLAKEWHPTRNAPTTPKDVMPYSGKKVWWRCGKGHDWAATLAHRSEGQGCPYCSGRKPTEENCLEVLAPWIAQEWDPARNGSWMPRDVTPYSRREIWWVCGNGHEAREKVVDRYRRGGCPECVIRARYPR